MNNRIWTIEEALPKLAEWRASGKRIVFTNGVFDILHIGHVTYLQSARNQGDFLILGLNNDASVKRLGKGDERPINPEQARAGVLAELRSVDAVILFGEDTPEKLIRALEPDVLVKGGDYDPNETNISSVQYMVGSDLVKARGGRVVAIPLVEGFSTTSTIAKMRKGN